MMHASQSKLSKELKNGIGILVGQVVFVSPELSSVRDYVITHSVRSMSVVCT